MLLGGEERVPKATDRNTKRGGPAVAGACDDGRERDSVANGQRLQGVSCDDFLDRFRVSIEERNRGPRGVAQPVAPSRRDAEDLRSRPPVRDGFFLNRIDMTRNDPSVDVEPELALVHPADPAQPDLALADFAVPRARGAHDLVRALDRLPEFGDLAHRLARRLPDIEDLRLRDHRPYTDPFGLTPFVRRYRIPEGRKCSHPLFRSGSTPDLVTRTFAPEAATLPITVSRFRSDGFAWAYRSRTVWIGSARTVAISS